MAGHSKWTKVRRLKAVVDADAEDFKADENGFEILTEPATFEAVHKKIEVAGIKTESAELTSLPVIAVLPTDANAIAAVNKLIDALEEYDDVKEVYSNAEFPDEVAA